MFHMMSCFNLRPDVTIEEFSQSLDVLFTHLKSEDLAEEMGPIARRQDDTPRELAEGEPQGEADVAAHHGQALPLGGRQ